MIPTPVCVLYPQDPELLRRVKAFLRAMAQVRHVSEAERLEPVLQQSSPALLIIDLRDKESRDVLDQLQQDRPDVVVIALGIARSEPLREAEQSGIYAAEDVQLDRQRFQGLAARAFDYLRLLQENRELREESSGASLIRRSADVDVAAERNAPPALPLLRLPRVFRKFDNVDALLLSLVENIADAAGVTRVGIFSKIRKGDR